jgi:hypothetical protein
MDPGTVASPKQFITDGNALGRGDDVTIIAGGVLVDGTVVYVELWGVSMDYTAIGKIQFRRVSSGEDLGRAKRLRGRRHDDGRAGVHDRRRAKRPRRTRCGARCRKSASGRRRAAG